MAELADALGLKPDAERRAGSNPVESISRYKLIGNNMAKKKKTKVVKKKTKIGPITEVYEKGKKIGSQG